MMKIGNTTFNKRAIKDMPFAKFDRIYRNLLKEVTTAETYEKLTGKKPSMQDLTKAKEAAEKVDKEAEVKSPPDVG